MTRSAHRSVCASLVIASAVASLPLAAGPRPAAAQQSHDAEIAELMTRTAVANALRVIDEGGAQRLRNLVRLTEVPAPPFMEDARGAEYSRMLRDAGADSVWTDEVGNVLALRRGTRGDRTVVLDAHLDTVFPEGTDVSVQVRGDTLFAPGIGDDTQGLVVVLAALQALVDAGVRTEADLIFVGSVGEEGLGDLRGVKHLFRPGARKIDSWIAVDGGGTERVAHEGIGSHRYRVTVAGPGGHSWGAFGLAHPHHALAMGVTRFVESADVFTSEGARTSYSVGRIGGGTSVNSIPFESWLEVDMRSVSEERLEAVDRMFREAMQEGVERANEIRRRGPPLSIELEMVGDRPSGSVSTTSPIIQRAAAATRAMGVEPELGTGSTNSNIPFSLGVPAVTVGRGGAAGGAHSLDEWWLDEDSELAVKKVLLIVVAEAGLAAPGAADDL